MSNPNLDQGQGPTDYDRRHNLVVSGRIVEVPVHHYHRAFGKSQFFNFRRIARTGVDVMRLWFALVIRGTQRQADLKRTADAVEQGTRAS